MAYCEQVGRECGYLEELEITTEVALLRSLDVESDADTVFRNTQVGLVTEKMGRQMASDKCGEHYCKVLGQVVSDAIYTKAMLRIVTMRQQGQI